MSLVTRPPRAVQDLLEQALYLAQQPSLEVAEQFLVPAESTFCRLAEMPGIWRRRELSSPLFSEVRQWAIRGFENYLVFYRPLPNGVDVLRVLHGARDIERIFDEDESAG